MLAEVAADPELKSLLAGMAKADSKSQVFYGANQPRPRIQQLSISRGIAVIQDCQDSTHAGIADKRTNRALTEGVARNHVVATMHLTPDGTWRVVYVTYPRTKC